MERPPEANVAIAARRARLSIGGKTLEQTVSAAAKAVHFDLTLKARPRPTPLNICQHRRYRARRLLRARFPSALSASLSVSPRDEAGAVSSGKIAVSG